MPDSVDLVATLADGPDGRIVTYIPYGGVARSFKAIVERQPSQVQQSQAGPYPVNTLEVLIPRDATNGVMSIQVRKDTMRFKKNLSDTDESTFTVQKILQEDAGLVASDGGLFRVLVQA